MPGVIERLRIASRVLTGSYGNDAVEIGKTLLEGFGFRGESPKRDVPALLNAYKTVPTLRSVVDRMATGVAMPEWHLYGIKDSAGKYVQNAELQWASPETRRDELTRLGPQAVPIQKHPFLNMLRSGNPLIVGVNLMKLTQVYLDIVGEAFWLLQRNPKIVTPASPNGIPVRAWPIPPHWVKPTQDGFFISYRSVQREVPKSEWVRFHDADPSNPYGRGAGIGQSLGDEMNIAEFASRHISGTLVNRAIPPAVVMAQGASSEATEKMKKKWKEESQGFFKTGIPFFTNFVLQIKELSQSFDSLQLVELLKRDRDTFVETYGVPPEILGILESANRATANVAEYIHSRYNLVPRLEFLRATFQERMIPMYDARLLLAYRSPVDQDRELYRQVVQTSSYAFAIDEIRRLAGQGPDPSGKGDLHWLPGKGTFGKVEEGASAQLIAAPAQQNQQPAPPQRGTGTDG